MSLKLNVTANYASQLYATLIGIVLVPLYLKYMGAEAYGLIGLFAMLQAWFNVLDLGLTPTIARESARYFGGALAPQVYRHLVRSLHIIFLAIAVIGAGILYALAPVIAQRWLHVQELPVPEVEAAVRIMGLSVAMRWIGGLYRGVITGAEQLVWLSGANALIATLRFAGVFLSMEIWGYTPTIFFWHQFTVAAAELLFLYVKMGRLLPRIDTPMPSIGQSFAAIRPLLRFSITIAFTSCVWVFVTQTDKLVLSGLLSLSEYGYFTMAVLVAGGITIVTGPITTALLPRLARLHAEDNPAEIVRLYHQFAQLVGVVAISLMVTLSGCAESLLYAWTGSLEVTHAAAPILRLYAIGNGLLALGAFPFYLQYARGTLRYHLIGNIGLVLLLIPAIALAASRFGGVGAGWAWLTMNIIYLFGWVAFVHAKLEPGLHLKWIGNSVLRILVPTLIVGGALTTLIPPVSGSRLLALLHAALFAAVCIATATMSSPELRRRLRFKGGLKRA